MIGLNNKSGISSYSVRTERSPTASVLSSLVEDSFIVQSAYSASSSSPSSSAETHHARVTAFSKPGDLCVGGTVGAP